MMWLTTMHHNFQPGFAESNVLDKGIQIASVSINSTYVIKKKQREKQRERERFPVFTAENV